MRCTVIDSSALAFDKPGPRSPCSGLDVTKLLRIVVNALAEAMECKTKIYVPDVEGRSGKTEFYEALERVFSPPALSAIVSGLVSKGKLHVIGRDILRGAIPSTLEGIGEKDAVYIMLATWISKGKCSEVTILSCDGALRRAAEQLGFKVNP